MYVHVYNCVSTFLCVCVCVYIKHLRYISSDALYLFYNENTFDLLFHNPRHMNTILGGSAPSSSRPLSTGASHHVCLPTSRLLCACMFYFVFWFLCFVGSGFCFVTRLRPINACWKADWACWLRPVWALCRNQSCCKLSSECNGHIVSNDRLSLFFFFFDWLSVCFEGGWVGKSSGCCFVFETLSLIGLGMTK